MEDFRCSSISFKLWSMAVDVLQVLTQDAESPGVRATLEIMLGASGVLRWSALDEHAMLPFYGFS